MINQDKWISSLPKINMGFSKTTIQLDHDKWINIDGAPAGYYSVCLSTTDMVKVFKIIVY